MSRKPTPHSDDKIILSGLEFYATHGVLEIEKSTKQKFLIDICLYQSLTLPGRTDDLKLTTDYSKIYETVRNVVENNSFNLIEALANNIAETIINNFIVDKITVTVKKPDAPIAEATFSSIAVQITREKQ